MDSIQIMNAYTEPKDGFMVMKPEAKGPFEAFWYGRDGLLMIPSLTEDSDGVWNQWVEADKDMLVVPELVGIDSVSLSTPKVKVAAWVKSKLAEGKWVFVSSMYGPAGIFTQGAGNVLTFVAAEPKNASNYASTHVVVAKSSFFDRLLTTRNLLIGGAVVAAAGGWYVYSKRRG